MIRNGHTHAANSYTRHLPGASPYREPRALMAEGRSNKAIALQLVITEHTVEKHVKNSFATLQLPALAR